MPRKKTFDPIEMFAVRRMWVCFPTFSPENVASMFDCSAKTITQIVRGFPRSNTKDVSALLHDIYDAYRRDAEDLGQVPKNFQTAMNEAFAITNRIVLRFGSRLSTISGVPQ